MLASAVPSAGAMQGRDRQLAARRIDVEGAPVQEQRDSLA